MFVESDSNYRPRPRRLSGVLPVTGGDVATSSLERSSPWVSRRPRTQGWPVPGSLAARLRALELDRQLAVGIDPRSSELLATRARQVTGRRSRRRVAAGLTGVLDRARNGHPGFTAAVRSDAREVLAARTVLTALAIRLRSGEPVAAQGMAILLTLLTDGTSPLYLAGDPGTLGSQLRAAAAALEPSDRDPIRS